MITKRKLPQANGILTMTAPQTKLKIFKKSNDQIIAFAFVFSIALHILFILCLDISPGPKCESRHEIEDSRPIILLPSSIPAKPARNIPKPYLRQKNPLPATSNSHLKIAKNRGIPSFSKPVFHEADIKPVAFSKGIEGLKRINEMVRRVQISAGSTHSTTDSLIRPVYASAGETGEMRGFPIVGQSVPQVQVPTSIVSGPSDSDQALAYQRTILQHIEKYKQFPRLAIKRNWEGSVEVRFLLHKDGGIEQVQIIKASLFSLLDKAAIRAIQDGAPYPPFPDSLLYDSMWFQVTLLFELK